MQYGNTCPIGFTDSAENPPTPYTASAGSVGIILPDGSDELNPPPVTITPGTASTSQQFQAYYTPTQAGLYAYIWAFLRSGIANTRTYEQFCFWSDVPTRINDLLQSGFAIPQTAIERASEDVLTRLLTEWPQITSYNDLVGNDRRLMDKALSLWVACELWPFRLGTAAGLPTLIKIDEFETRFAPQNFDGREAWLTQAEQQFNLISVIRDARTLTNISMTYVSDRPTFLDSPRCIEPIDSVVRARWFDLSLF